MVTTMFNDWSWIKSVAAAIGPTLLLLWVCWRSGSWHVLLARAWWLLHGSCQPEARVLRDFHHERTALMRFRWMTGISVRTLKHAKTLITWCADHDEEIGDVRACGMYFDSELPGLNLVEGAICRCAQVRGKRLVLPGTRLRGTLAGLVVLAGIGIFLSIGFAMISGAMVTVKQGSGTWLLLYPDHVSLLRSPSISFNAIDCAKGQTEIANATGLFPREVHLACGWFDDAARFGYITRTVEAQRVALATLCLLVVLVFITLLRWIIAIGAADAMRKRLGEKQLPPSTPGSSRET